MKKETIFEIAAKQNYTAEDLVTIIEILRDKENGCPWDKVQTHQSIRMNFLEEAYEAVDALDLDDAHLMCEELGDVLMQVVFHAVMEQERERFFWADICDGVCKKLIFRHPHIFGQNPELAGIKDWDTLKNMEKGRKTLVQDLDDVPAAMPALMRAAKLQKRAARYGWDDAPQKEALAALTQKETLSEQEVGKLLFQAAALARANGIDPEQALEAENRRFIAKAHKDESQTK